MELMRCSAIPAVHLTEAPIYYGFFGPIFKGRLYALSQRRFQGTLKLAPHAVTWLADIPGSAHGETSLADQGPQGGPAQPRQHEGGSTKDILVIR